MKYSRTKFIAVVSLLIFLLSATVCASFFYIVSKKEASYVTRNEERAQNKFYRESVRTLMGKLEETTSERASLIARIPTEGDVIGLITLIESLGKEQGVALEIRSLTIKPVNEIVEILFVSLAVKGSHTSVIQTLKLLENIPYQSRLNKVQMTRMSEDGDGDSDSWSATFELQITKFKKL